VSIFPRRKEHPFDDRIAATLLEMDNYDPTSTEYQLMLANVERLSEIKTKNRPSRLSPDTLALIAGNLVGIVMIVAYEQKHVMSSKANSERIRPK